MQTEFADRFGRRWRVELDQVRANEIEKVVPIHDPLPQRPGLSFVLFSADGRARWSTWVPFRSLAEASAASEDLAYLDRVVEELYYTAMAGT